jgi:hypothetical protein
MDRPRILRLLRIAFSVVCGIICLLLFALWVRSYWRSDVLWYADHTGHFLTVGSAGGSMYLVGPSHVDTRTSGYLSRVSVKPRSPFYLRWANPAHIRFPHWVLVVMGVVIAAIPWARVSFSLRTLLIATTLVAVLFGAIVYAMR